MSKIVIQAENISKQYRIGKIGTGTITHDLNRWWSTVRGKEDPYLKIGEANDRASKGLSEYVWSLRDINFEINQGDAVGIIGRNGAGKSTLLKLLSKVTRPTTGQFKIDGRIASLLEVGTGFHPEMSGRENIYLNGAILGMTKKEISRKFDEIVDFSGVERYIDTPVKRYSSGMYVRLAFAVAAHLESEILIVDEVLAVGDAEFQKKCLGKMGDVTSKEGRTVLFVSHNMAAVKTLCQKGIVLENGSIVFQGTSEDAANFYLVNNFDKSAVSIDERRDRKGDGRFKVENIRIINSQKLEVSDLILGEPYKILFAYKTFGKVAPDQFTIVVQIFDQMERLMTTFGSDELGLKFENLPDEGTIEIDIPKLNLRAGVYYISFMFSEKMSFNSPHKVMDHLTHAVNFTILSSDIYQSGVILRPGGYVQESQIIIS